jgi:ABC-type transport system involved in multi-copper enzyme maturation permease subunit
MLWYKSWLESRWRFASGLVVLMILAVGTVFDYPAVARLMPAAGAIDTSGAMGRLIKEALELQRDYRGFVWFQWYRQNLVQVWTLFAVLLGSGGLAASASGRPALFTLSLPVSRNRLLAVRVATGLAQLMVLAVVPSLLIPLLSPAIGQSYSFADTVVHGGCLFIAGAAVFCLALLLSTVFRDLWRPLLVACAVALVVAIVELLLRDLAPYGPFRVMTAESYFRAGQLPWLGLVASAAASGAMLYVAALNFNRQDF